MERVERKAEDISGGKGGKVTREQKERKGLRMKERDETDRETQKERK